MGLACTFRPWEKVKHDSARSVVISVDGVLTCNQITSSCELVNPLGGVGVQPSTDAGTGQTAAG